MTDPVDAPAVTTDKSWIRSKTIVFNAAIALLTVLASETDTLKLLLSNRHYASLMLAIALVNVLLRTQSTTALTKPRLKRRAIKKN